MSDEVEREIRDAAWSRAKRLTWLLAPAPALYVLVGALLMFRGAAAGARVLPEALRNPVFLGTIVAGALCVAAAARLSRRLRASEPPASLSAAAQRFVQTHVLALGLAEFPAVLAFAYFLLTGDLRRMIALSAACVLAVFFFLPSRAALNAYVSRRAQSGDSPT